MRDWTGRFVGSSPAVVRPGSVAEVAAVLAWCAERGIAVVPQGGNTGLVAGGVPLEGEVVLSVRRLDEVGEVDHLAGQVTVGAGVSLADLHRAAAGAGWDYGVDLAARDSATVGGTVATNAGGIHVLAHGSTRAQLTGIEAVRSDGSVVSRLAGLVKDNTGYDLAGLLCGSEGTLAVLTAARVRLVPRRPRRAVAAVGFTSAAAAVAAIASLRRLATLVAAEVVWPEGRALARRHGVGAGVPDGAVLVVECRGDDDVAGPLAAVLADLSGVGDEAVAVDDAVADRLWAVRERQTELVAREGVPHKFDVTFPVAGLAAAADELAALVVGLRPHARVWRFGHAGDGNLHLNVTGLAPDDHGLDDAVLRAVVDLGGSISAEHGIGRAKAAWLPLARSAVEREVFAGIRRAWDPAGILNPGVLVAAGTPPR